MKRILLICAVLALTASVRAQPETPNAVTTPSSPTVALCDASWMDAERVRALLAVEFGPTTAVQVDVHSCTLVAADVRVRFGTEADATERTNHLDLSQTARGARSRLVALVVAELVRLGAPASATPVVAEAPVVAAVTTEPPVEEPVEDPAATDEVAAEAVDLEAPSPEQSDSTEPVLEAEAVAAADESDDATDDVIDEVIDDVSDDATDDAPAERCEGWSRFGRGPCSWAISLGYGAAVHQLGLLGETREGPAYLHQVRLTARWRYLFGGVRMYGVRVNEVPPTDIIAGGFTVFAGVEWWARRWSKNVLALRTGIEAGQHGFRGTQNFDACGPDCASFGEPTFGGFTSVRYERAFGILRGAVELELGWTRGFRIDLSRELVAGLGGPSVSLNIDLSIGRAE